MPSPTRGPQIATGADGIATANIVDLAVTTAKIDNTAVTTGKIAGSAVTDAKVDSTVIVASGSNAFTGDQSMGNFKITNLAIGTAAADAVTKSQLDSVSAGLDPKASSRLATAAALPANTASGGPGVGKILTMDAVGVLTLDGVATVLNDRLLIKDEGGGTSVNNGIYDVTTEGTGGVAAVLTRATDFDTDAEVTPGAFTFVSEGSTQADSGWILSTPDPISIDVTALTFVQFTGAGQIIAGAGLTKSVNTLDVGAGSGITVNADDVETTFDVVGSITTVNAGDSAAAGTNNASARGDHQHAVATAAAVSLAGANAEGSATNLARSDHAHARDAEQQESVTTEAITNTDTLLTDTLNFTPINNASAAGYLNGILQTEGAGNDYTLAGTAITWLASTGTAVNMKTADSFIFIYISQG